MHSRIIAISFTPVDGRQMQESALNESSFLNYVADYWEPIDDMSQEDRDETLERVARSFSHGVLTYSKEEDAFIAHTGHNELDGIALDYIQKLQGLNTWALLEEMDNVWPRDGKPGDDYVFYMLDYDEVITGPQLLSHLCHRADGDRIYIGEIYDYHL